MAGEMRQAPLNAAGRRLIDRMRRPWEGGRRASGTANYVIRRDQIGEIVRRCAPARSLAPIFPHPETPTAGPELGEVGNLYHNDI
nr:hypothetical protein [Burkholderia mayonis]